MNVCLDFIVSKIITKEIYYGELFEMCVKIKVVITEPSHIARTRKRINNKHHTIFTSDIVKASGIAPAT